MCDALVLARVGLVGAGPRVAGEADVECVEVVHLHQLLVEPAAMRGLKTLKCSLYVKCKLS